MLRKVGLHVVFLVLLNVQLTSVASAQITGFQQLNTNAPFRAVYLIKDPKETVIQVDTYILAGESDFDGSEGRSHYLEHLVGAKTVGLKSGAFHADEGNAYATNTMTNYHNSASADLLPDLLNRVKQVFTKPDLDAVYMKSERDIVAREYDLRFTENPTRKAHLDLREDLLGDSPLARSVIGKPEEIVKFSIVDIFDDYERFYQPANAVLVISSPDSVATDLIVSEINTVLGGLDKGRAYKRNWPRPIGVVSGKIKTVEVANPRSTLAAIRRVGFALYEKDVKNVSREITSEIENRVISGLLSDWLNSRLDGSLQRSMIRDQDLAQSAGVLLYSDIEGRLWFQIDVNFRSDDASHAQVHTAIATWLNALRTKGISDKNLKRLKKRSKRDLKKSMKYVAARRAFIASYLQVGLLPPQPNEVWVALEKASVAKVNLMIEKLVTSPTFAYIDVNKP